MGWEIDSGGVYFVTKWNFVVGVYSAGFTCLYTVYSSRNIIHKATKPTKFSPITIVTGEYVDSFVRTSMFEVVRQKNRKKNQFT